MLLYSGIVFPKNFVNSGHVIHSSAYQILLTSLLYPRLSFTHNSDLSLRSTFFSLVCSHYVVYSLVFLTWLMLFHLILIFIVIIHAHIVSILPVYENKPPPVSISVLVGFCRHYKSPPHTFIFHIFTYIFTFITYSLSIIIYYYSEVIWFGSRANLAKVNSSDCSVYIYF